LAMHRVTITSVNGASDRLVLRRYVRPEKTADDPAVAAHEAAVLRLVERIATTTPHLVGVDPTGDAAGVPAVLMTELPGRPEWAAGRRRWMRQLVAYSSTSTTSTPSPRMRYRGGRPRRPCGTGRSRSSTALSSTTTARSSTATSTPATCCGIDGMCRVSSNGKPPASGRVRWTFGHCRINRLHDGLDTADIVTRTLGTAHRDNLPPVGPPLNVTRIPGHGVMGFSVLRGRGATCQRTQLA
jgi:hypothetical protein